MPLIDQTVPSTTEAPSMPFMARPENMSPELLLLLSTPFVQDTLAQFVPGQTTVQRFIPNEGGLFGKVNPRNPRNIGMTPAGLREGGGWVARADGEMERAPPADETLMHEATHVAELTESLPKPLVERIMKDYTTAIGGSAPTGTVRSEVLARAFTQAMMFMREHKDWPVGQRHSALYMPGADAAYAYLKGLIK